MAKSNTFMDVFNQMYGSGTTAGNQQIQSGQGSTLSGTGPHDPYANMFGNLDPNIIKQLLGQITIGLSPEEKEELDRLTLEHSQEVRKHKLDAFKKVAPEMRQFVINALTWHEELSRINDAPVGKSQRLTELETKSRGGLNNHNHNWYPNSTWNTGTKNQAMVSLSSFVGIPEGLTVDDLKQAHIEATLEEEMLNGEEEKT